MIRERIPSPPQRLFEKSYRQLVTDVHTLMNRNQFQADQDGRFRLGDVYLVQELQADGTTIRVSLQNALTEGPLVRLGDLA